MRLSWELPLPPEAAARGEPRPLRPPQRAASSSAPAAPRPTQAPGPGHLPSRRCQGTVHPGPPASGAAAPLGSALRRLPGQQVASTPPPPSSPASSACWGPGYLAAGLRGAAFTPCPESEQFRRGGVVGVCGGTVSHRLRRPGGEGVCCSPTGRPQPSVTGPRCPPCPGEARGPAADGGQHQAGEDVAPSPMTQTLPWGLHSSLQTAAALLFPLAASPSEQGARATRTPGQGDGLPAAPGALAPSVPWVRPVWSKAPRDTQAERGAPRPGPSQQPLPPEKMTPLALQEHSLLNSHQQCLFKKVPFY